EHRQRAKRVAQDVAEQGRDHGGLVGFPSSGSSQDGIEGGDRARVLAGRSLGCKGDIFPVAFPRRRSDCRGLRMRLLQFFPGGESIREALRDLDSLTAPAVPEPVPDAAAAGTGTQATLSACRLRVLSLDEHGWILAGQPFRFFGWAKSLKVELSSARRTAEDGVGGRLPSQPKNPPFPTGPEAFPLH